MFYNPSFKDRPSRGATPSRVNDTERPSLCEDPVVALKSRRSLESKTAGGVLDHDARLNLIEARVKVELTLFLTNQTQIFFTFFLFSFCNVVLQRRLTKKSHVRFHGMCVASLKRTGSSTDVSRSGRRPRHCSRRLVRGMRWDGYVPDVRFDPR